MLAQQGGLLSEDQLMLASRQLGDVLEELGGTEVAVDDESDVP